MKLRVILNSESLRFGVMCEAQRELDREENRIASKSKKLKKVISLMISLLPILDR